MPPCGLEEGKTFGDDLELAAAVPLGGTDLTPVVTSMAWAEYGGRMGVRVSSQLAADLSFVGVSDLADMNTDVRLRAQRVWRFKNSPSQTLAVP